MRLHTIFGADVTVFHYPKHAVAVRGPRKRSRPTVGFKSLPAWTPQPVNVAFARSATNHFGEDYEQFIMSVATDMSRGRGAFGGKDPERVRQAKHQMAAGRIANMEAQLPASKRGRVGGGFAGRMPGGFREEVPDWYERRF
jgi:hypothetical protein